MDRRSEREFTGVESSEKLDSKGRTSYEGEAQLKMLNFGNSRRNYRNYPFSDTDPECVLFNYEKRQRIEEESEEDEPGYLSCRFGSMSVLFRPGGKESIQTRLRGSLFRKLNEFLYTNSSEEAFAEYMNDSEMFVNYHKGYEVQKKLWPTDPLENIIDYISQNRHLKVIGDFGCGKALIGETFGHKRGYKIHSFDLNCPKELAERHNITVCNIKNVPLEAEVLDLAVFCLSLMGTDWPLFLKEGCRVLKENGTLIVTEVSSRIEDVPEFIRSLEGGLNLKLVHGPTDITDFFTQLIFTKKPSTKTSIKVPAHSFSRLRHHYGLRLTWMRLASRSLPRARISRKKRLSPPVIDPPLEISSSLLKPCVYKRR
ncbi:methyltransferase domain-containing protein [Cryptosporidium felis]|nr:methyltransferase domain-containing protein [Cryptosporidium felis]